MRIERAALDTSEVLDIISSLLYFIPLHGRPPLQFKPYHNLLLKVLKSGLPRDMCII